MIGFLQRWKRRSWRWTRDLNLWFDTLAANTLRGGRYAGRIIRAWWLKRRLQLLLQSMPALAVVTALTIAVAAGLPSRGEVASTYKRQADQMLADGNFSGAWIGYQRLVQLERNDPANIYGMAICLENLDQKVRAGAMMEQLAPVDRQGYGHAHLWLAKNRAGKGGGLKAVSTHLRFAFAALPDNREVNALLGMLYLDLNRPAEAEKHLMVAAQSAQEFRLLLARSYAMQGKRELMAIETQRIVESAKASAALEPAVPIHRLIWADALLLRREFSAAESVLADGLLGPRAEKFRRPLALLYVAWHRDLVTQKRSTVGEHLALLQRGLAADPDCPEIIMALHHIMRADKKSAAGIRQTLQAELTSGKAPGAIHFVLGSDAFERGDVKSAKVHFEIAYKIDPNFAAAANNLAWLLAVSETPDLPLALTIIQSVVERWPNEPTFRGTRGHILAKSGRHQEALIDLLKALPVYQHKPEFHERLAKVYSRLGLEQSAAAHQSLAKEKKGK